MILSYKYRLKGKRAARQLRRFSWAVNQVWNYCVATQREVQRRYKNGSKTKWPSHFDFTKLTKGASTDLRINSKSISGVCKQFSKSRDQHKKCPYFRKSSGSKRSLGWIPFPSGGRQLDGNAITYLGNTYRFFGAKRRPLPEAVKGGVFVEDSLGRWWVALHVEVGELLQADGAVGIDLGLKTLATCSDGVKIENPRPYRQLEQKLAIAQRAGRNKQAKRIHIKIANVRRDHLHKESAKIASRYSLVAVGDVSSSKLARTKMAKSVYDAGWSTFKDLFRYKVSRHGGIFLEVDEKFTSQTCSSCGDRSTEKRPRGITGLGIREWKCSLCGAIHDRDVNAAKNILFLALSAQRPAEDSRDLVERRVTYGR